jgi:hypothetical protein
MMLEGPGAGPGAEAEVLAPPEQPSRPSADANARALVALRNDPDPAELSKK